IGLRQIISNRMYCRVKASKNVLVSIGEREFCKSGAITLSKTRKILERKRVKIFDRNSGLLRASRIGVKRLYRVNAFFGNEQCSTVRTFDNLIVTRPYECKVLLGKACVQCISLAFAQCSTIGL